MSKVRASLTSLAAWGAALGAAVPRVLSSPFRLDPRVGLATWAPASATPEPAPRWRALGSALGLISLVGCGYDQPDVVGQGGSGEPEPKPTLVFEPSVPLQLEPGKSAILAARLAPPATTEIRFGIVGDALNSAYLSSDSAVTGPDGRALITLFAPQTPGAFRVRASWATGVEGQYLSAERPIVVGSAGFASIVVTLEGADALPVADWTAAAFPNQSCADLDALAASNVEGVVGRAPLTVGPLAAGVPMAVVVTGGRIARGCADLSPLGGGEVRPVVVAVTSLPFELTSAVEVEFLLDAWSSLFRERIALEIAEEVPASSGPERLLDEMEALVPEKYRDDFGRQRSTLHLTDLVSKALPRPVPEALLDELDATASRLEGAPWLARFNLNLDPRTLEFLSFTGVPAKTVLKKNPVSWQGSIEFDGVVSGSGSLSLNALAWLRDATFLYEDAEDPEVSERLAVGLDCPGVAVSLSSALPELEVYPECGESCLEDLCVLALGNIWSSLGAGGSAWDLELVESGTLERDQTGKLSGLSGSFLVNDAGDRLLSGQLRTAPPRK